MYNIPGDYDDFLVFGENGIGIRKGETIKYYDLSTGDEMGSTRLNIPTGFEFMNLGKNFGIQNGKILRIRGGSTEENGVYYEPEQRGFEIARDADEFLGEEETIYVRKGKTLKTFQFRKGHNVWTHLASRDFQM